MNRYLKDNIYTFIGPLVLSLNPFKWDIPHVQDERMIDYIKQKPGIYPHAWSVADRAFRSMKEGGGNQTMLVSGESGAGKTEACKTVIKYLSMLSCSMTNDQVLKEKAAAISEKIKEASPILEAFGNAKTVNNDNSSRFGKFIKLQFDRTGLVLGAETINYLLEKV
jgi:myosin heavy subunit